VSLRIQVGSHVGLAIAQQRVSPYPALKIRDFGPLGTQILLAKSGLAHTFPALYAKGDCETQNKESGGETL
jgi:hypothetical protein